MIRTPIFSQLILQVKYFSYNSRRGGEGGHSRMVDVEVPTCGNFFHSVPEKHLEKDIPVF